MQRLVGKIRKAIQDYNMIEEGDIIAVGVSGGKDSITLLYALSLLQKYYPVKFRLMGLTLTMGYEDMDFSKTMNFCKENGIEYHIKETQIAKIVFDVRKEKNPCSLCANLRRGALNNFALEMGCNKVALAHHYNDLIETFLLSIFYEGRINTFLPVTKLDRTGLIVLRPMIYVKESEIKGVVRRYELPVVPNQCPANGNTKRQYIKDLLKSLSKDIPDLEKRIFSASKHFFNLMKI
ncbi:tRNA(Ile)-lysidine synthase TilS/MesJ [Caldanaerobius fijiensis DSM 17918]|uniref:tRNA(Ile)-lysidine synthase TilS/MesJ n=1 Tax=Caldanaerobius fijiensis DSM 17918 TaxID=1121256 RepID=A0A1M5AJE7_9THEO|nr:ATP-binding protein [Caldanaerobius fijiensis]SHF30440.1 tRNA(Ile)-lysidine synthase TilS/MesJ [Caldanaerobius fijiensis DSM 17918]